MDLPRITVVTPSFNQAQFLEMTLKSVLDQNYPNLEYLLIDENTTIPAFKRELRWNDVYYRLSNN